MPKTEEETKQEETQKQQEAEKKWDAEKQRADQAQAVADKAREEAKRYAEQLGESKAKLEQLTSQLDAVRKEQQSSKEEQKRLVDIDTSYTDAGVVKNIEALDEREAMLSKQVEEMNKRLEAYEKDRKQRDYDRAVEEARNEILADCDNEFSPKYRNEALEMADELVDSGKEKRPIDKYSGYKLMRHCYQAVHEKHESKQDSNVSVDSGKSSVSHSEKTRKTGTRAEVLADMKKNKDWLKL